MRILPLGDSLTFGAYVPGGYRAPLYQLLTSEDPERICHRSHFVVGRRGLSGSGAMLERNEFL